MTNERIEGEQLDAALKSLFGEDGLVVDPASAASVELRDAIVAPDEAELVASRVDGGALAPATIDLADDVRPTSTRSPLVLVAAACVLIALVASGVWASQRTDDRADLATADADISTTSEDVPTSSSAPATNATVPPRTAGVSEGEPDVAAQERAEADLIRAEARAQQIDQDVRALFAGGVSEQELSQRWDGYPYGEDEKAGRIAAYQSGFEWVQSEPINIDVAIYSQFEGTDFPVPIVTVRSRGDLEKVAVFVMGWSDPKVLFGRIPELDEQTGRPSSPEIWARDDTSVTIPGVGIEGGVSAFLDGAPLETSTDHLTLTTTIELPVELQFPAVITVVAATPELPAASVVLLAPHVPESLNLSDATTECYPIGTHVLDADVDLWQVEPNFDDANPGINQNTSKISLYTLIEPRLEVTTQSRQWDLDGDGVIDTLQHIDVFGRAGGHIAEGYRVCGTAIPTRSFWNDPAEGSLVVRAEAVVGIEWPRGGLVLGSDDLDEVLAGQHELRPDQAYTFDEVGLLALIAETSDLNQ